MQKTKGDVLMLNQVILVGRIVQDPVLREVEGGKKVTTVRLAIQRSFKNSETGNYDTDFIDVDLWAGIAETAVNYCSKGATIGVKARVGTQIRTFADQVVEVQRLIADKITFINKA